MSHRGQLPNFLPTTFVGFYLASASGRRFSFAGLFNTLLGTLLVASGTGTLNQYPEQKFDAQMRRTADSCDSFHTSSQSHGCTAKTTTARVIWFCRRAMRKRHAATFYCAVGLLGTGFIYFGWEFVFKRSRVAVRRLLTASIVYLPL